MPDVVGRRRVGGQLVGDRVAGAAGAGSGRRRRRRPGSRSPGRCGGRRRRRRSGSGPATTKLLTAIGAAAASSSMTMSPSVVAMVGGVGLGRVDARRRRLLEASWCARPSRRPAGRASRRDGGAGSGQPNSPVRRADGRGGRGVVVGGRPPSSSSSPAEDRDQAGHRQHGGQDHHAAPRTAASRCALLVATRCCLQAEQAALVLTLSLLARHGGEH